MYQKRNANPKPPINTKVRRFLVLPLSFRVVEQWGQIIVGLEKRPLKEITSLEGISWLQTGHLVVLLHPRRLPTPDDA
jgi:hypothetical protein